MPACCSLRTQQSVRQPAPTRPAAPCPEQHQQLTHTRVHDGQGWCSCCSAAPRHTWYSRPPAATSSAVAVAGSFTRTNLAMTPLTRLLSQPRSGSLHNHIRKPHTHTGTQHTQRHPHLEKLLHGATLRTQAACMRRCCCKLWRMPVGQRRECQQRQGACLLADPWLLTALGFWLISTRVPMGKGSTTTLLIQPKARAHL